MSKQHVVVVGAGVIGLSCALELQKAGYHVTIVARDFPGPFETMDPLEKINYTSPWGGAHNRWVPFHPSLPAHLCRDHYLSVRTWERMASLYSAHPHTAGITFLMGIEYFEDPGPEYLAIKAGLDAMARRPYPSYGDEEEQQASDFLASLPSAALTRDGRYLTRDGSYPTILNVLHPGNPPLDDRIRFGFEYQTWCVNPMVYLCFLLRRFTLAGGKLVHRTLASLEEVFSLFPSAQPDGSSDTAGPVVAVVNASGTGIVPDPSMTISRGQTVLVAEDIVHLKPGNPTGSGTAPNVREDVTVTRQNADGTWSFVIPRGFDGGTIVGGTKEVGNWDPAPSRETRERLLRDVEKTHLTVRRPEEQEGFTVLRDIVGRRPLRLDGPRIEGENIAGKGFVMHAYGMGGRGYELSWGVAEKVVEKVKCHVRNMNVRESEGVADEPRGA
ncbi:hypothetical protein VTJ49DRAFT_5630 [Mycothermus thermophilus]|uniref:FAD dependent oxidoreductase domain-containing protein n=1 Tax=Humicola insolens TaxID=85995 RepID=A0ABR3V3V3_HUMIN